MSRILLGLLRVIYRSVSPPPFPLLRSSPLVPHAAFPPLLVRFLTLFVFSSGSAPSDIRPAHVFHGYGNYPPHPSSHGGPSMAPPLTDGLDGMGAHGSSHPTTAVASTPRSESDERDTALFGDLPANKRRKFIVVDDASRNARVRVRVMLEQVNMKEIPDSYRKANSVFPRSYFPTQMPSPPSSARGGRFFHEDDADGGPLDDTKATRGKTLVPILLPEGGSDELAVPKISRAKKRKEVMLNDFGYRMSWSQSRVFSGRTMFLQKSCMSWDSRGGGQRDDGSADHVR